jgi:hypothetical protein
VAALEDHHAARRAGRVHARAGQPVVAAAVLVHARAHVVGGRELLGAAATVGARAHDGLTPGFLGPALEPRDEAALELRLREPARRAGGERGVDRGRPGAAGGLARAHRPLS